MLAGFLHDGPLKVSGADVFRCFTVKSVWKMAGGMQKTSRCVLQRLMVMICFFSLVAFLLHQWRRARLF